MAQIILLTVFLLMGSTVHAQNRGVVLEDEVSIYQKGDFDSKVIGKAKKGQVFEMSKNVYGAFYRVRLKNKQIGYIADNEIRPAGANSKAAKGDVATKRGPAKAFEKSKYRGLDIAMIRFREETMGMKPTANVMFYGLKIGGPDFLVSGDFFTEVNLLFHSGAPSYYEQATGKSTTGMVFLIDAKFLTVFPQSPRIYSYFGFGPLFKYSAFTVGVESALSATGTSNYAAEDMVLGAAMSGGMAFHVDRAFSIRTEFKYYWEKIHYWGYSLSGLMSF